MAIACGCCGGEHDTVAEVRACCAGGGPREHRPEESHPPDGSTPPTPDPPKGPPPNEPTPDKPTPDEPPPPTVILAAGPSGLGRSLVVAPGQGVPETWADHPRFVIDADVLAAPAPMIAELGRRWAERLPCVVELAAPLDRHPGETDDREPWRLDPSFSFPLEQLAHLIWSNAFDLRRPDAPTFEPVTVAVTAAAVEPIPHPADAAGNPPQATAHPAQPAGPPTESTGDPTEAAGGPSDEGSEPSSGTEGEAPSADARPAAAGDPRSVGTVAEAPPGRNAGDVRTAAGPAWCDGGPLDLDLGERIHAPVLHTAWLLDGKVTSEANPTPTASLADDQLAAVTHRGGPCRVISPAGSGKTRTLTERARHLVADCGLPPTALTLVAYNTRAAGEMRERLSELSGLQIRTLNSLGLAIVGGTGPFRRQDRSARPPRVIEEREVRDHLERLVKFPRRANTDPAALWIEALGQVRLGLRSPEAVETDYQGDVDGFAEVFPRYQEALRREGVVDFDDQIYRAIEVLLREPEARRRAQRSCRVMLVDEFQDLTPAHLLLIRLLAAPTYDVFGVGDDDQTIYGYQGADPRWLIEFDGFFPGAGDHPLTVNYRCPPAVIRAARNLLTRNQRRVTKAIEWPTGRRDEDDAVRIVTTDGGTVGATVDALRAHLDAGAAPRDIVALARVNATLAPVQVALAVAGIPVDPLPGIRAWLGRTGVGAALAWLDLALDPRRLSPAAVREAARRPPRGLSPKLIEWMSEQRDLGGLERLAGRLSRERDQEKLLAFVADLCLLAGIVDGGGTTADVMAAVRGRIGLGTAVESLDRSRGRVDRSTHGDDFDALHQLATLHPDPRTFRAWLVEQLNAELPAGEGGRVHLSTVHRVKGLEWPHVVVHDASSRLFPHRLVTDAAGREEERRIFHVALTRCSASVTGVAPAAAPSHFLDELARPGTPPSPPAPAPPSGGPPPAPGPADVPPPPGSRELDEALRAWRKARATAAGVPAYVVFSNKTLDDLVRRRPTDYPGLLACHGIGPAKAENYGDEILAVIAPFAP